MQIDANGDGQYDAEEYKLTYNESGKAVVVLLLTLPLFRQKRQSMMQVLKQMFQSCRHQKVIYYFPTVVTE